MQASSTHLHSNEEPSQCEAIASPPSAKPSIGEVEQRLQLVSEERDKLALSLSESQVRPRQNEW
ncbi:MAG: hypothetical protein SGPRY_001865 [Prymnesium sp.]